MRIACNFNNWLITRLGWSWRLRRRHWRLSLSRLRRSRILSWRLGVKLVDIRRLRQWGYFLKWVSHDWKEKWRNYRLGFSVLRLVNWEKKSEFVQTGDSVNYKCRVSIIYNDLLSGLGSGFMSIVSVQVQQKNREAQHDWYIVGSGSLKL